MSEIPAGGSTAADIPAATRQPPARGAAEPGALQEAIRRAIFDCSAIEFYVVSDGGIDEIAMLAARAAESFFAPHVPLAHGPHGGLTRDTGKGCA